MNFVTRPEPSSATRHKLTYAEMQRMWDAGVFPDRPDLELIEGELYEMGSDGVVARAWNIAIGLWLYRALGDNGEYYIVPDKTLPVTEHNAPKPDFYVYPASVPLAEVTGANTSLVIEVSDSTLDDDRDLKAPIYGRGGVRDCWIVDCQKRQILVFRLGESGGFGAPTVVEADQRIEALLIPGLTLRLDEIRLPR